MDKKILSFKASEVPYDTIMFQDQIIKVKKRLSISDMSTLVVGYIREYFSENESPTQVVFAELSLKSILFDIVYCKILVKISCHSCRRRQIAF